VVLFPPLSGFVLFGLLGVGVGVGGVGFGVGGVGVGVGGTLL